MAVPLVDCPSTQVIGNNDQSLQLSSRLAKKLSKLVTHLIKRYISSRPNSFTPTGSGQLQLGRC